MSRDKQPNPSAGLLILGIIWLVGAMGDRFWFSLDHGVPAWDQADYLNGALNYWQALQTPNFTDSEWWRQFWLLSSKIPPLTYILTVPFFNLFSTSADAAALVMLLYSALLLVSVYGLGVTLFNVSVGLWAAALCQLLPGLYRYRTEFLLDYPLTAVVTFAFWLLTVWKLNSSTSKKDTPFAWLWAVLWGLAFGLALMVKQTALMFLLVPILWVFGTALRKHNWQQIIQLMIGLSVAVTICLPWYRTNWLLILTSGKRATVDSAIAEGDPALTSLHAWTYYGEILPYLLSIPLIIVPVVGLLIYWLRKGDFNLSELLCDRRTVAPKFIYRSRTWEQLQNQKWRWLGIFLIGGYLLSSLNINKDARYILPLLPVLSVVLACGLLCWRGRWGSLIRTSTVGIAVVLMVLNLFPLGGEEITEILSPRVQHYTYLGERLPHQQVVTEIIKTSPYLRSTLGVLPSTEQINQHNFSFYGRQFDFQVVGRQVGVRDNQVEQDARSLDWFVTKTGKQGSIPDAQVAIVKRIEQGSDFVLQESWQLPDNSTLQLYHRVEPSVEVQPLAEAQGIELASVRVPAKVPPNAPVPVTYEWTGSWQKLQSGLVLLTWQHQEQPSFWLHDHAVGMGTLDSSRLTREESRAAFKVIERTAMLPANAVPGTYTLEATYLNRETGETESLAVPSVTVTIDPAAKATPAPELDLVTQLRAIAPSLAQGIEGLELIFEQTARINQYDPLQDYLVQAEKTLSYRLQQELGNQQQRLDWHWAIALSRVLQQDVEGAISAFQKVRELEPENPDLYAYLAFVYLYDWQPSAAQAALEPALALEPHNREFHTLNGIAALMKGNLIKAWVNLSPLLEEA